MSAASPVALIILDGWGLAPDRKDNAVTQAKTPFMDSLKRDYPHTTLDCFGPAVGLPEGQMGNSEVGHLNLGAGRVVYQDITRIDRAIAQGELQKNPELVSAMEMVKQAGSTLHLLGLVSDGGVHSSLRHLHALIEMASSLGVARVAIHAFLDGRDTPPDSGAGYLEDLQAFLQNHSNASLATVGGRYWGMDRDKRWNRVQKGYDAIVRGRGVLIEDPVEYVRQCYKKEEFDEFVAPAVVCKGGEPVGVMNDGDAAVFFNFRADRAREMTWALNQPGFDGFDASGRPKLAKYVCMTQYDEHLGAPVAFPPEQITGTLAEVVSRAGLKQLHIAETEKYAHVTFFFNGGREDAFAGEDRVLIDSPKDVDTYDQKPEMSAYKVTDAVMERIENGGYDLIVMNYANGDMVGHTGVFQAARQAMEHLDACLGRVIPAVLKKGGAVLLTADHGNAEQMYDPLTDGPYTAHTVSNPVPFILIGQGRAGAKMDPGRLCDVAPTALALLGLEQPPEMTGKVLFE